MSFPQNSPHVKVRRTNLLIAIIIIIIATTAGIVYATLNQSIPSTSIPPATVSSTCTSIVTSSTVSASSGVLEFTCTGGTAAFQTVAGTSTPTFTGYTACPVGSVTTPCYADFGYMISTDTTDCVAGTTLGAWFHHIEPPAAAQTFAVGSWDYCAVYAAPSTGGTLPSFSIAWT